MANILKKFKNRVKEALLRRNIIISRPPGQFSITSYKLAKAKARGLHVHCAIDGGAASGGWAEEIRKVYPEAFILCIEPREDVQPELQERARRLGNVKVAPSLIGREEGTVTLYQHKEQSSILPNSRGEQFGTPLQVPVTTLDRLVQSELIDAGLPYPDLIKLDLQGAELIALEGASECLAHAQAVLLEVSLFAFQQGTPLLADVVLFMSQRGFRGYDILGLWHRPLDGALAQGDFLFLSERSPLLANQRWGEGVL